jgi:superfamily I DNA and/or RNA helicase
VFVKEQGKLWAIEHDFMDSSYSSLYKGMQSFLSAPQQRRDLLLLQREPEIDKTLELKGDYGDFNDLALHVKRAKDLFLIIGPPGTGKTSYGLLYTVKEELMEPDSNILLLSYTNRAVDEICSKLVKEGIDFIRIGSPLRCAEEYRDRLLSSIAQNTQKVDELKDILLSTRVIVGTTTSLNSNISLFQLKQFSLAVIDEASQILEPHLIGLLSASHTNSSNYKLQISNFKFQISILSPAIRKFVLIGDHKQLPAVVQQSHEISKVHDAILNNIHLTDCRQSLFERLLKQYVKNEDVTYMLKKQGRMHPDIALFPNITFYNNKLEAVPLPHQKVCLPQTGKGENGIDDLLTTRRIAFIASEPPSNFKLQSNFKLNQNEAEIIAAIVARIYEIEKDNGFDVNTTVGVIVPYRNQIAAVRKAIADYTSNFKFHARPKDACYQRDARTSNVNLPSITIDTVERFQGSQRKYIIYGFTVQKNYQLNFLTNNVFEDFDGSIIDRKLNVAMTRAEEHLIMVGNPELLSRNLTFSKLIQFLKSQNAFFKIKKEDFINGNNIHLRHPTGIW